MSLPGGCAIGTRPVDLHLKGLERARRRDRAARGLHPRARAARACRAPSSSSRCRLGRRHREPADGGEPGRRRDGDRPTPRASRRSSTSRAAWSRWARGSRASARGTPDDPAACRACTAPTTRVLPDRIETGTYAMAAAITGGDARAASAAALDLIGRVRREARARPASSVEPSERAASRVRARTAQPRRRRRDDPALSRASRPTCRRSSWR